MSPSPVERSMNPSSPSVSIAISARNEGDNLVDMVQCLLDASDRPPVQVVVVDDGSTDGSGDRLHQRYGGHPQVVLHRTEGVGVARGRNAAAALATGEVLVFLDGHCYTPPGWLSPLLAVLADPTVGLVGTAITDLSRGGGARAAGVTWRDATLQPHWIEMASDRPHAVPLLPGGSMAMRAERFHQMGRFDPGMIRWGSEAEELSLRCWLLGYRVMVQPASLIYHQFREASPYGVEPEHVIYNRLRLAVMHFQRDRAHRVIHQFKASPQFDAVKALLEQSDVLTRRNHFLEIRRHDDDWFCQQFHCSI